VWRSEFTTKVAPKGGSTDFSSRLNVQLWDLRGGGGGGAALLSGTAKHNQEVPSEKCC
jgi:hypothetical protein